MTLNEADTCRKFVVPRLQAKGWGPETGARKPQKLGWRPPKAIYRVEKMCYGKIKVNGKANADVGAYGHTPLLKDIPLEAYDYVVNGKSALDWVVERRYVKTDKDSGIVNDANAWAVETMGNPRYPLELFMRVVTVSLETVRIVGGLPGLEVGK